MKTVDKWLVGFVYVILLVSCGNSSGAIKPGDKIGKTQFLDYCDAPNVHEICGDWWSLYRGDCEIPPQYTTFWISTGLEEETLEELDRIWADTEWEMTYDGIKIDLQSFGTYDLEAGGKNARVWNVCISDPAEGLHVVQYSYDFKNDDLMGSDEILKFNIPVAGD